MSKDSVGDIVLYIVARLDQEEADNCTTRLVKLLYLLDLEYYRAYGKTVTNLEWIRYKYGPYAMAFPDLITGLDLDIDTEEFLTRKGHRARRFRAGALDELLDDLERRLSHATQTIVDHLVRMLALEDINVVLDYVYFHTEPMLDAQWMESLDFSKAKRGSIDVPIHVDLPARAKSELKVSLERTLASIGKEENETESRVATSLDNAYFEAMRIMDSESRPGFGR